MPAQYSQPARNTPRGNGQSYSSQKETQSSLQAISAPYNFVPLSDTIVLPQWGAQVSHDIPFADGYCGELHYTLTAHTPLLVGGRQTKSANGHPGEVRPFQLPDGRYAIPGSSLKGLLRSVIEIAGFGRMSKVDEVRPSLRDISKSDSVYALRVRDKVHTGFLRRLENGTHQIIPCLMARLEHRDLEDKLGKKSPIFEARLSVRDKYAHWEALCRTHGKNPREISFDIGSAGHGSSDAAKLYEGGRKGIPVFTGQISDSTKPKGKHRDFVFFDPRPQDAIAVPMSAWRDFLRIHGDEDGKADMSWPGYWKARYRAGEQVPVFYLRDGGLLRIGLAFMPKLAGDFSTHDLIAHTAPAHLAPPGAEHGYDLADLLFGAINGERQADALRGRVSFETACALGQPQLSSYGPTILNGPKPSYFPNYITQNANPKTWSLKTPTYATYISTNDSKAPTLRGFKRYPVRPKAVVQPLADKQQSNTKVQVNLHTLEPQTQFRGRIVFHNLKPEELGALLWALTWGGQEALRHSLGMGKPFGFGQVQFQIDPALCRVIPNDPAQPATAQDAEWQKKFLESFERDMESQVKDWAHTPQLRNLLAMADPGKGTQLPAGMELRHMRLESKQRINDFQQAKQSHLVLADYAVATGSIDAAQYRPLQGKPRPPAQPTQPAAGAAEQHPVAPRPAAPAVTAQSERWPSATLAWNKGSRTLDITAPQGRTKINGDAATALIDKLPEEQRNRLVKKGELKSVGVQVTRLGNQFQVDALHWPT